MTQPIGNPSHIGNLDASQLGPQPTYLPEDHPDVEARTRIDAGEEAYAYARVGYHRGLDALRAAGWRGAGPIPYSHEVNRGFLRALYALGRAAGAIGEGEEAARIEEFLHSSDPKAVEAIGRGE
jgi:hypothetical protein